MKIADLQAHCVLVDRLFSLLKLVFKITIKKRNGFGHSRFPPDNNGITLSDNNIAYSMCVYELSNVHIFITTVYYQYYSSNTTTATTTNI